MSLKSRQQRKHLKGLGLGAAVFAAILSGCSSSPSTPPQVVDRTHGGGTAAPARPQATAGAYRVQRGDTLYSIAFRFGWDWKALAARNQIAPPYLIRPGQVIRFDGQQAAPQIVRTAPPVIPRNPPIVSQPPRVVPPVSAPVVVAPPPASKPPSPPVAPPKVVGGWAWPASGAVLSRFASNGSLNKGIDIAGELGQPVLAASDGSVVYAGSGLRGYGELVIIKHNDIYVSAYGHNRRLLVKEGQRVKAGQAIAEMGSTGTDRVKLHFEIRRQGKPVDPLQYLPRR